MNYVQTGDYSIDRYRGRLAMAARRQERARAARALTAPHVDEPAELTFELAGASALHVPTWWLELEAGRTVAHPAAALPGSRREPAGCTDC